MKIFRRILAGFAILLTVAIAALAVTISYTGGCEDVEPAAIDNGMRAVVGRCYGGPEVLTVETIGRPEPADDEVLVRVRAAALNPLDWHYMRGSPYIMRLEAGIGRPADIRTGVDFSGVVEAVGADVTRFAPGDAVFGGANGAFAEYLVVRGTRALAQMPDGMSFEAAAGLPIAAITALQAVRDKGDVGPGDRVLVNGASGGVGTYTVQIAKAFGATVTGVSSARNHELVSGLGADRMIDYKTASYVDEDTKYDVIIDMIGNHSIADNRKVLADGGRFVVVGGAKGNWIAPFTGPIRAMLASSDNGQTFHTLFARLVGEDLEALADLVDEGKLVTAIDREYALDNVAEAMAYSESGRARGKIVLLVSD